MLKPYTVVSASILRPIRPMIEVACILRLSSSIAYAELTGE